MAPEASRHGLRRAANFIEEPMSSALSAHIGADRPHRDGISEPIAYDGVVRWDRPAFSGAVTVADGAAGIEIMAPRTDFGRASAGRDRAE
jgi:hypothetical protein